MNQNYYINKKFTISYLQKYMRTTIFKHVEHLEIQMQEATSRLYNQDEIDLMAQEEYDVLNKADIFFEKSEIDFRVNSIINDEDMLLNEDIFNSKFNFLLYEINDNLAKEKADWFYLNIYISDLFPFKKEELISYYTERKEIKNHFQVINAVVDHYIECEAYRTVIYLLQKNLLFNVENRKKILKNIIKIISERDDNYALYLRTIKELILNKKLFYTSKEAYKNLQKTSTYIPELLYRLSIKEHKSLTNEIYTYLKVPLNVYGDKQYKRIRHTILENLHSLELKCILVDYHKNQDNQFNNLRKALEIGLELIALALHLKKIHNNKKQRVVKHILESYKDSLNHDLSILQTIYYFNEHNAHHLQFVVVPLSHYLALTYEESFEVLQSLGFYHHESPHHKKGNFRKHFRLLQEAYNSNFRYLYNSQK